MNTEKLIKNIHKFESDIEGLNSSLETITYFVSPEMFKEESDIDDTLSIQKAIDNALLLKCSVIFKSNNYITSSPLLVDTNTHLQGATLNNWQTNNTTITNTTSKMFDFKPNSQLNNLCITGICFDGGGTNKCFESKTIGTNYKLSWGTFNNLTFKNFSMIFDTIAFTGFKMYNLNIENCDSVGKCSGSDNVFENWFINSVNAISRFEYIWELPSMMLSTFKNLFFTGSLENGKGAKNCISLFNNSHSNLFIGNWFDYFDGSALVLYNNTSGDCYNNKFIANNFRGCARDILISDSVVKMLGCRDNTFVYNSFLPVHQGIEMDTNAYHFRMSNRSVNGVSVKTSNIVIEKNTYNIPTKIVPLNNSNNSNIFINEPSQGIFDQLYYEGYKRSRNLESFSGYVVNAGSTSLPPNKEFKALINQSTITDLIYTNDVYMKITSTKQNGVDYRIINDDGSLYVVFKNTFDSSITLQNITITVSVIKN